MKYDIIDKNCRNAAITASAQSVSGYTMKKTTKVAAVALAAALSGTLLAGCDISTNVSKDYAQTIAEVNITESENFANSEYASYGDVIGTTEITKRDMVAYFVSTGYSLMQSYGWTYYDTFEMISETLVNRQIYIQYAMLYLLDDESEPDITVAGYEAAVAGFSGIDRRLAGLSYFLDSEETAQALYSTRQLINNTLDSQEESYLDHDHTHDDTSTARTAPTGIDTETEDYYNPAYRIYTGSNAAADCPGYETLEGSTSTTRRKAYSALIASLRANSLVESGEDVSNIESLTYFKSELANAYETAIINKLTEKFEDNIRGSITETYAQDIYNTTYERQATAFAEDTDSFETALDGVSDTSFVLTAPEANYGYVINILIPFSTSQSLDLENAPADLGDVKGNNFLQRAAILKNVRGTDQRGTWFTDEDYAFDATGNEKLYTGGDSSRSYLFFEDSLGGNEQYERVPNYLGYYTYNGSVSKNADDEYVVRPNRISIDEFIAEMEGYLKQAASEVTVEGDSYTVTAGSYVNGIDADDTVNKVSDNTVYYNRSVSDYYTESGAVDYSKFVYYAGKVEFANGFNANEFFLPGSAENVAYSVMNELSFAYNTDTAGLNDYFGYVISTGSTDFVAEFEYAAQYVCRQGAGNYVVVPSDYGWHIVYCTFSFVADDDGKVIAPYTFNWDDRSTEGTFSYLFYEALCSDLVGEYASIHQSNAIEEFKDCAVVYKDAYADLSGLDTAS